MDWIGIAIAAFSGALAALAARLIVGFNKERKAISAIAFVIFFIGSRFAVNTYLEPKIRLWDIERQLREIPLFNTLSVHEPDNFHYFAKAVYDSARKGSSKQIVAATAADLMIG